MKYDIISHSKTTIRWARGSGFLKSASRQSKVSPLFLIAISTAFLLAFYNDSFWAQAFDLFRGNTISLLLLAGALYSLTIAYLLLFSNRLLLKPFIILNILLCSVTSYYQDALGVIIDREMIQNAAATTVLEARHLITDNLVYSIIIWGIFPSIVVAFTKVRTVGFIRTSLIHSASFIVAIIMCIGFLWSDYKSYSSVFRLHSAFLKKVQPIAPVRGAVRYVQMMTKVYDIDVRPIGLDAQRGSILAKVTRPILTLLVVGETVRDQNFGLSGYYRNTTPQLTQRDVASLAGLESCGTSTAVSLPCMFSHFPRNQYSYEKGLAHENLLDILQRAGFDVEWWDVNTGDKNVAARVTFRNFYNMDDSEFCSKGECTDGLFLKHLKDKAAIITRNTIIVMHQIGNHGPAYYLRYPKETALFIPDCRSANFNDCTQQEIINAYDNAIAYTDDQLAKTIDFLESQTALNTSLIYVSDHGESLGEDNLYLHGAPYWIAPVEQKTVPMIVWMSKRFQQDLALNNACIGRTQTMPLSHDNYFHSILGMLDVQTSEYNPALDIFTGCRSHNTRSETTN